jgi:hypothetical protein
MSYSFTITAASKAEAMQKVADAFAKTVAGQPVHKVDQDAAIASACAFIGMLGEPPADQEVYVTMHGSLGWHSHAGDGDKVPSEFLHANVSVAASLRNTK